MGHFCNREEELKTLINKSLSLENVTLSSPRRFGKTSLVRRAQHTLQTEHNFMTVYIMLFGITSVDELATKFARAVYNALQHHYSLTEKTKKFINALPSFRPSISFDEEGNPTITPVKLDPELSGMDLLEKTMEDMGAFIAKNSKKTSIALDEFQEIVQLNMPGVEGLLREHIQNHEASYVFIGSHRRILLDMFTNRKRPFYQSTWPLKLKNLPAKELCDYIIELFDLNHKACSEDAAQSIVAKSHCYPYYAQKLAGLVFDLCDDNATTETVFSAYNLLMEQEQDYFQANIRDLSKNEIRLLKSVATAGKTSVYTKTFLRKYELTTSMVQKTQTEPSGKRPHPRR